MPHHSDGPGPELTNEDVLKRFFKRGHDMQVDIDKILNVGPTHKFPEGKLTPDDKGEIRFSVGRKDDKVILDFGVPVKWIGMPADGARELGKTLIKHAKKIGQGK